jgi:hypothetical protein
LASGQLILIQRKRLSTSRGSGSIFFWRLLSTGRR